MADRITLENALNNELSIMLISSNTNLLTSLQANIVTTRRAEQLNRPYDCKVHITSDLRLVKEPSSPVKFFDYYVFIIEPNVVTCLKEIEGHLKELGGTCGRQKICLVAIGANNSAAIKLPELWKFAQIYQFNLLIGDFKTEAKAKHLASRILNLCEASCGLHCNGFPLVGKI